jgi:hypothetical protein
VGIYRFDAVLPYTTGLPRDVAINTFHVETDSGVPITQGEIDDVSDAIVAFYTSGSGSGQVEYWLSSMITRTTNGCRVECYGYDEEDTLDSQTFTLAAPDVDGSAPLEVCLCVSLTASGSGPIERRRGRFYLGPLTYSVTNAISGVAPVPNATFLATVVNQTETLHGALVSAGCPWSVYSRVGNGANPITGGWVDNEFDTQRRRQVAATARTTLSF